MLHDEVVRQAHDSVEAARQLVRDHPITKIGKAITDVPFLAIGTGLVLLYAAYTLSSR